jgi:hypothetical protein
MTTKKELLEMIKDIPDNAKIILKVRGNSSTDYTEQGVIAYMNSFDFLVIMDELSY